MAMAEWFPLPIELQTPHQGHEAHLCVAHNVGWVKSNLEEYKKLVRNGKFVCKECGRVAAEAKSLCEPEPL
jgi:hypothetical protein